MGSFLTVLGGAFIAAGIYLGIRAAIYALRFEQAWIVLVGLGEVGIGALIGASLLFAARRLRGTSAASMPYAR